jgi:hypothetical protein
MADLAIAATEVLMDEDGRRRRGIAGETIAAGDAVHFDSETNRWHLSNAMTDAEAAVVDGIALNSAGPRQTLRIQIEGAPILGASSGIVEGALYGLSGTAGKIAPLSDAKVTHFRTVIGCGGPGNTLSLGILESGVQPLSVVNTQLIKWCIATQVATNAAQVGAIIDRLGYEEVTFIINIGSIIDADATFTVLLEGGNDSGLSDAAPIADADMISQTVGTAPEVAASFNFGDDGEVRKIGFRDETAAVRYLRLTITPALNTATADFAAYCVLGYGPVNPITQPVA